MSGGERAAVRRARAPAGQQRRSPEPTQPKARRDDYGANAGYQGEAGKRRLTVLLSLVHPHSQAPRMAVFAGSATSLRSRLPECARLPRQSRRRMACRSAFAVAFEEAAMARAAMARAVVVWWLIAVFIGTAVLKHRRMAIANTNIHRSTGGASSLVAVRPLHSPFFKLKIIPPKVLCGSDSACLTVYSSVSPSWLCNA